MDAGLTVFMVYMMLYGGMYTAFTYYTQETAELVTRFMQGDLK